MARTYSAQYKSTLAKVSGEETPRILLQIDHPELSSPIRVINDTINLTSNGFEYIAFPFEVTLPDDFENKLPKATLSISNVGKDLMFWIESTAGGQGSTATFFQVMRSRPNQIEWSISMSLFNVLATNMDVSAELGFENLFAKPAVSIQYRPTNSPGLF
jgi:hypothetical protein